MWGLAKNSILTLMLARSVTRFPTTLEPHLAYLILAISSRLRPSPGWLYIPLPCLAMHCLAVHPFNGQILTDDETQPPADVHLLGSW